uniref:Putative creb/atf family transcription factor n=1 Tax=Lutzomyia longipalpis TaxID=7200 RepID=A0A1B0CC31_LUTLO
MDFNLLTHDIKQELLNSDPPDFMGGGEWPSSPDDFLESLFSMDDNLIPNLDDDEQIKQITSSLMEGDDRVSSYSDEPDFPGFDLKHDDENGLLSLSSAASDSGLSSDHLDLEMSPEYEPLSPVVSSPGPSISERGGQNSPMQQSLRVVRKDTAQSIKRCRSTENKIPQNVVEEKKKKLDAVPKEMKLYKMTPINGNNWNILGNQGTNGTPRKKVTIQLQKSQIIKSPVIINKDDIVNAGKLKKLVTIQRNAGNGKSILLPVSLQNVKDVKTIKIINPNGNKTNHPLIIKQAAANLLQQSKQGFVPNNVMVSKEQLLEDSMSDHTSDGESVTWDEILYKPLISSNTVVKEEVDTMEDEDQETFRESTVAGNKLILTFEEKRLLAKEGITLPINYPLTKHEERELKRIRRKIRNKISAQDSRKRKKEYVDGLEERVKQCTEENHTLMKRIKLLQSQNANLTSQMKKLQALLSKGTNTAQPATCLMVLLLSMALIAAPNLKLGKSIKETELAEAIQDNVIEQNRNRNLLFDSKDQFTGDALVDEDMNFDDLMTSNGANVPPFVFDDDAMSPASKKARFFAELDLDDSTWQPPGGQKCTDSGQKGPIEDLLNTNHAPSPLSMMSGFEKMSPDLDIAAVQDKIVFSDFSKVNKSQLANQLGQKMMEQEV